MLQYRFLYLLCHIILNNRLKNISTRIEHFKQKHKLKINFKVKLITLNISVISKNSAYNVTCLRNDSWLV